MPEPTASPPLPLERYASMHAEVEACGELDSILEREKLTKEQWLTAQVYWMRRMADEAERRRFETTNRYNAVFTAKRKVFEARLKRDRSKKAQPPITPPAVGVLEGADAELGAPLRSVIAAIDVPPPPAVAGPITAREPIDPSGSATPFVRAMPSAGAAALGMTSGPTAAPSAMSAPSAMAARSPMPPAREHPSSAGFAAVAPPARVSPAAPPAAVGPPAAVPPAVSPAVPPDGAPAAPAAASAARTYGTMAMSLDQIVPPTATPFKGANPPPAPSPPASARGGAGPGGAGASSAGPSGAGASSAGAGSAGAGSAGPSTAPQARSLNSTWTSTPQEEAAVRDAMPFKPQGGASPPPATTGPLPPTSIPLVAHASETAPIDVPADVRQRLRDAMQGKNPALASTLGPGALSHFAAQGAALPFERKPPIQPPPPPASSQQGAKPPPAADDDDDDDPRTKMVDPGAVAAAIGKATPFAKKPDAPPTPPSSPGSEASPRTVSFDGTSVASAAREALPFGGQPGPQAAPQPAKAKRFTLNVFASLTAEIAENPADAEAIRTRYGVTEAEHHEESMRWTEEFSKSDEIRQRYFGIVQRYRGYIQQRKRT
ncbi:MAG: hypothetical protein IPM79_20505 [Polyangiaceae bacterium]|nr:hypothetical protein [Polyangiaceae bacterium]MBK8939936.1 hypothetical protein [Polyangiaceae bacterium]